MLMVHVTLQGGEMHSFAVCALRDWHPAACLWDDWSHMCDLVVICTLLHMRIGEYLSTRAATPHQRQASNVGLSDAMQMQV